MVRWIPELSFKTAADPANALRRSTSSQYVFPGIAYSDNWSVDRAIRDGFERSLWVFKSVDAIASNQARIPIVIRRGDEHEGDLVTDDPILRLLNRRPNKYETAAAFRYRLSAQLLLSKKGAFVEVVRDRMGRPAALYLLPPHRTNPIPDAENFVSGYQLTQADGVVEEIEPERVLWIKKPHPIDPYTGITPLEAAGLTVDTDFYARLYNRNFMQNDGRPGGLIGVKGQMLPDDAAELKRRFSGGPAAAGRTTVIEADDISWVDTATTPRDAQYVESMGITKTDILLAFGVPESVIGNASGRTYDNADAEENIFWRVTMLPHLDLIAAGFDELTVGGWDDEDFVGFNTDGVDVLRREEKARHDKLMSEFQVGLITVNEYREGTGRDPHDFDVPGARSLFIAGGKVPIAANEADQKAAEKLMPVGTPDMAGAPPGGTGSSEPFAPPRAPGAPDAAAEFAGQSDAQIMASLGFKTLDTSLDHMRSDFMLMPDDLTDEEFARVVVYGTATPQDIARERASAHAG